MYKPQIRDKLINVKKVITLKTLSKAMASPPPEEEDLGGG